ncbi:MAG: Asp-tRNA(Asn)/Glu-tRNA(Gln) amidotransferase subunit GatA [Deltaproteobacteria bacterium]|nr:Asp-tRNA(Asn)/Glu-tRNA(Gln) amidotransferase subunit GatA [Deltaproteobacteria bacterium]
MNIVELSEQLAQKKISSVEATKNYFARIEKINPKLNAYIHLCQETALQQAKESDARRAKNKTLGKLDGIPIALKDIFVTEGIRTTCGSKILENYLPPYDGTTSKQLKEAGSVLLGKLNMDEFAMGSSNENSYYGPVKNPWDLTKIPGGSSGGSAAAIAADLCVATLGTDTGGSIRQPAALCGIVGLKPTYGRVTRYGIIAFASSLDQAGPMTKTVTDSALMLNAIAGFDKHDSTSLNLPTTDFTSKLGKSIKGMKIGMPKEYFIEGTDPEIIASVKAAAKKMEELGARVEEISLPHTQYAIPCYYVIAPAEASANLARYDGVRFGHRAEKPEDLLDLYERSRTEGFGPEVTMRIIIGTFVLSSGYYDAYYIKAQKVRTLIRNDFETAFKKFDFILTPTTPTPAFGIGEKSDDPLKMYLSDIFTVTANLAGLPAISLPCGFSKNGLPLGLQLIGKNLDEETLLQAAFAYEQATEWHKEIASVLRTSQ